MDNLAYVGAVGPALQSNSSNCLALIPHRQLGEFIYFRTIARNIKQLQLFGVTHVINTAEGKKFNQVDTSPAYYQGPGIQYYGIPGVDIMGFPLYKYFTAAADYIHEALESGGKERALTSPFTPMSSKYDTRSVFSLNRINSYFFTSFCQVTYSGFLKC